MVEGVQQGPALVGTFFSEYITTWRFSTFVSPILRDRGKGRALG